MDRGRGTERLEMLFAEVCRLKHNRVQTLLKALGLYRGQPALLGALWEQEGLTHTELAQRLGVQPATITKMVNRMERAGFVVRRQDPVDQRVSRVYLTEAGHAIRTDVERIWEVLEREAFAGFNAEERTLLAQFFRRIRENLQRAASGDPSS